MMRELGREVAWSNQESYAKTLPVLTALTKGTFLMTTPGYANGLYSFIQKRSIFAFCQLIARFLQKYLQYLLQH